MGKDTLKVGIVGSRKYENRRKIKEFIFKLKTDKGADTIIVSGGCKTGADYYAKKYALELGLQYQEFPRGVESKGAMSTINYAKKFRKKTLVID